MTSTNTNPVEDAQQPLVVLQVVTPSELIDLKGATAAGPAELRDDEIGSIVRSYQDKGRNVRLTTTTETNLASVTRSLREQNNEVVVVAIHPQPIDHSEAVGEETVDRASEIVHLPPQASAVLFDRQQLEVIPYDECRSLLEEEQVGRVAFHDRGETTVLPVNYVFVAGTVIFRTAPGSKLDVGLMKEPMSFEIDGWEEASRTGWSVLMKGVSDYVNDPQLTTLFDAIGVEPWANDVPRDSWIRIRPDEISGRRIVGKADG